MKKNIPKVSNLSSVGLGLLITAFSAFTMLAVNTPLASADTNSAGWATFDNYNLNYLACYDAQTNTFQAQVNSNQTNSNGLQYVPDNLAASATISDTAYGGTLSFVNNPLTPQTIYAYPTDSLSLNIGGFSQNVVPNSNSNPTVICSTPVQATVWNGTDGSGHAVTINTLKPSVSYSQGFANTPPGIPTSVAVNANGLYYFDSSTNTSNYSSSLATIYSPSASVKYQIANVNKKAASPGLYGLSVDTNGGAKDKATVNTGITNSIYLYVNNNQISTGTYNQNSYVITIYNPSTKKFDIKGPTLTPVLNVNN